MTCAICNDAVKISAKPCGVVNLESRPRRCYYMRCKRSDDVGNRLVQKSHKGHPKYPNLKSDEYHVFSFGVIQTVIPDLSTNNVMLRVCDTHTETGQFNDHRQEVFRVIGVSSRPVKTTETVSALEL